jgi:hypothetical protein
MKQTPPIPHEGVVFSGQPDKGLRRHFGKEETNRFWFRKANIIIANHKFIYSSMEGYLVTGLHFPQRILLHAIQQ